MNKGSFENMVKEQKNKLKKKIQMPDNVMAPAKRK